MTEPKVAKPKKPVTDFSLNCCVTHKDLDIRDGGFTPLAGLLAAACMAIWRGWQQPALRKPMLWGLTVGALAWANYPMHRLPASWRSCALRVLLQHSRDDANF